MSGSNSVRGVAFILTPRSCSVNKVSVYRRLPSVHICLNPGCVCFIKQSIKVVFPLCNWPTRQTFRIRWVVSIMSAKNLKIIFKKWFIMKLDTKAILMDLVNYPDLTSFHKKDFHPVRILLLQHISYRKLGRCSHWPLRNLKKVPKALLLTWIYYKCEVIIYFILRKANYINNLRTYLVGEKFEATYY